MGFVYWVLCSRVILPALNDYTPSLLRHYAEYGRTPGEILKNIAADPLLPFRFLFQEEKAVYVLRVTAPFLYVLPFQRRWWVPAIPMAAYILFASNGRLMDPGYYYTVPVVLWMAVSTLTVLMSRPRLLERAWLRQACCVVAVLMLAGFVYGAVSEGRRLVKNRRGEQYRNLLAVKRLIPEKAVVLAPTYIANHLACRPEIHYLWPERKPDLTGVDFIVVEYVATRPEARYVRPTDNPQFSALAGVVEGPAAGARFPDEWRFVRRVGTFYLFVPRHKAGGQR
jgi:hypothetical protein